MIDLQHEIRQARRDVLRIGGDQEVIDYLEAVAPFRPGRDTPGTPGQELHIHEVCRLLARRLPGVSMRRIEREVRDEVLWWRWSLHRQIAAWRRGQLSFGEA